MPSVLRRRFIRLLVPALTVFGIASLGAVQAQTARSTRDGVFSETQASAGKRVFEESCLDCHTAAMWGTDWEGKSVADVFEFVQQFMPEANPGSLTPEQTRAVLAYILQANQLPAGAADLPDTIEGLRTIRMEGPP